MSQDTTSTNRGPLGPNQKTGDAEAGTPMFAVWLSLAFIVILGAYGLNLGLKARSQTKSAPEKTSQLLFVPQQYANAEGQSLA